MKRIFLIIIFLILIIVSKSYCISENQSNDSISFQRKFDLLYIKLDSLENEFDSLKNHSPQHISSTVAYLSYSLGFVAVIFAMVTAIIGYITFNNYKKLEASIINKINDANNAINSLESYKKKLRKLEKSQNRNLDYFDKSMIQFSSLFKILSPKSKLDVVSERIAIRKIYSDDSRIRFNGISELFVYGTSTSLSHLETVIQNPEEKNENISTASLVKREILSREKNRNQLNKQVL